MKIEHFLYLILGFLFYACSGGMYDSVKEYYDEGELNYIAKVDSVSAKAGKNRVQFTWRVLPDPRVKELYVTWANGSKDATIPIDFSKLDENRFYTAILNSVDEGSHVFHLYHLGKGDRSVPTEIEANSYGDRYEETVVPRPIRSITIVDGEASIIWGAIIENCEVEISYTNVDGTLSKHSVDPTETTTIIDNVKPESPFSYVSKYLPEINAIDTFSVTSGTVYFPKEIIPEKKIDSKKFQPVPLPRDIFLSHQFYWMFDGDLSDGLYSGAEMTLTPAFFTFDLGVTVKLSRYTLWYRPDLAYQDYSPKKWKVYGALEPDLNVVDTEYWETGFKKDWTLLSEVDDISLYKPSGNEDSITNDDMAAARNGFEMDCINSDVAVRYLRFEISENWAALPFGRTVIAELEFYGYHVK